MKTKIEIRSAMIGLAVGVLITLGIAATSSPGSTGRYQIVGVGSHGLIIDTATGQVWRGFFAPNGGTTDGDFLTPKIVEKK